MTENSAEFNNQAIQLAAGGCYKEAIACFRKAIKIDGENHLLWYNLGVTYRDYGELEKARQAMITSLRLDQTDEVVLNSLALICYSMGLIPEALSYCMRAIHENQNNAYTWNNLGVILFFIRNYKDASEAFEASVSINPNYEDALINLRDTYEEMGNEKGAEECRKRIRNLYGSGGSKNA